MPYSADSGCSETSSTAASLPRRAASRRPGPARDRRRRRGLATQACRVASGGSGTTSSNTVTVQPAARRLASIGAVRPCRTVPASVTSSTLRCARRAASHSPRRAAAPLHMDGRHRPEFKSLHRHAGLLCCVLCAVPSCGRRGRGDRTDAHGAAPARVRQCCRRGMALRRLVQRWLCRATLGYVALPLSGWPSTGTSSPVLVDAVLRALAAQARLLDAAEGRDLVGDQAGVVADHAVVERLAHAPARPAFSVKK